MDDHLRVGARSEPVTLGGELLPQLTVVVDLAVQDDDDGLVLIEDRLIARLEVDDREPLHPESHALLDEGSARIGAAMLDHLAHTRQQLRIDGTPGGDLARYPAHRGAG